MKPKYKKPELLAPAGNLEKLKIAFKYGADAVYFGGEAFNVRAAAKNFSFEDIKEGAEFAHNLGKKLYCTVNVMPRNEELDKLLEDDTVLLESDLIFDKQVLKDLVETPDKNLAVVSPFESWMDGTCTLLNEKNEIISILDKAKFNWQNTTGYYKTVYRRI